MIKSASVKAYEKMSRPERRVAIAKDVIKNLDILEVESGFGYVVPHSGTDEYIDKKLNDQQIAENCKKTCTVCARGAMMICKISKFNNFSFKDISNLYLTSSNTSDALSDAFSCIDLFNIENAFECNTPSGKWFSIINDKDRLRAIMQNIIDHNGKFKPTVEYTVS